MLVAGFLGTGWGQVQGPYRFPAPHSEGLCMSAVPVVAQLSGLGNTGTSLSPLGATGREGEREFWGPWRAC